MKTSYAIHLRAFTSHYVGDDGPNFYPENSLKMALGDLISQDGEKVANATAWLRHNVRGFAQLP